MKRYISALLALFCVLAASPVLAAQDSTSGFATVVGGATRPVTRLKNDLLILGDLTIAGNNYVVGSVTLTTPLTAANIQSGSAKRELLVVPLRGLAVQALDDSTVFKALVATGRAGIIKRVSVGAITPPIGGVNSVAVLKNSVTAVLAASFDPTGLVANVAQFPALNGTAANLATVVGDTIEVQWTTGVQTTDAIGPTVTIEFEPTDF